MPPVRSDMFEFEFNPVAIRTIRNRLQLSQAALADWLDIPVNTISRWETGATTPDAKALAAVWSIASVHGIEPEFFIRQARNEMKNRTNLNVLWEYPSDQFQWESITEDWSYLKDYIGVRFPSAALGVRGVIYRSSNYLWDYDYGITYFPGSDQDPRQRLAKEGLKTNDGTWGVSNDLEQDVREMCSENPHNTILILATNNAGRATLISDLINADVDTYIMPTTDDCSDQLLNAIPSNNVIHWDEPFVISKCVKVIDELKHEPITRSEFGNQCKERLNDDGIFPQDVGFSRRNPYGSVLRWLEANEVVRVVPTSGKGNRVRIHRLRRHLNVESTVSN